MEFLKKLNLVLAYPLLVLIWLYQKTVSPDHGLIRGAFPNGYCKFYPTCSRYAFAVLKKDGLAGLPKAFKRVVKCNPYSLGGVDLPYPEYKT
jgi:putative membrane protein insertion efficiency factor